ncbi:TMEM175 family protein [Peptostreptococcus stomatis]|uniref:TMEM175 family protein n=1 Tax=Peptostreptococcus stomatis TaxID=341694 RepID=UPI0026F315A4|nr:TMEM175 family protein [Peptostreptococcus stomatis]
MNKSRIEAITDGIIAIAATIMVLELGRPATSDWNGLMEIRHTFLAYIISFFMIYIVWSMHHDLFNKASIMSKRTFIVNGIWLFVLTLVPFTTAWVGSTPQSFLPEILYILNLLVWSIMFQWLDYQIRKDNPGVEKDSSTNFTQRAVLYGGLLICLVIDFIKPIAAIYLVGVTSITVFIIFFSNGKRG